MIYAVNKITGEHRKLVTASDHEAIDSNMEWRIIEADPDGWIEWQGGPGKESPMPRGTVCDIRHRSGEEFGDCLAGAEDWDDCGGDPTDIIAYRPILDTEPDKPQAPEWDGEGMPPVGVLIESRHKDATPEWANPDFHETIIVAMGNELAIFTHPGDARETVGRIEDYDFRPIRSEEDRCIGEMVAAMEHAIESQPGIVAVSSQLEKGARALYRAGYRKTGGE